MQMQRGRKSASAIAAQPNVTGKPSRLTAPASLTTAERTMFVEFTVSCSAQHFRRSDIPLMVSYIEATLLARDSARDPDRIATWEKAIKLQCSLATRLRLTPSARSDPKTVARREVPEGPFPWDAKPEDET